MSSRVGDAGLHLLSPTLQDLCQGDFYTGTGQYTMQNNALWFCRIYVIATMDMVLSVADCTVSDSANPHTQLSLGAPSAQSFVADADSIPLRLRKKSQTTAPNISNQANAWVRLAIRVSR